MKHIILFFCFSCFANSQSGTEVFSFLSNYSHTRLSSLGNALVGNTHYSAHDINPSSIVWQDSSYTGFDYQQNEFNTQTGSLYYKTTAFKLHTQLNVHYTTQGNITTTNEQGDTTGSITPFNLILSNTWAYQWQTKTSLGLTVKLPIEYLGDFQNSNVAWGTALNLGFQHIFNPQLRLGLSLLHLGKQITPHIKNGTLNPLPLEWKAGLSYQYSKWLLLSSITFPNYQPNYISIGSEYTFYSFSFRLGGQLTLPQIKQELSFLFLDNPKKQLITNDKLLFGGIGYIFSTLDLHYGASLSLQLGWIHQLSFSYFI